MPQNKLWDFLSKQVIGEDVETPKKTPQDPNSDRSQDAEANSKPIVMEIKANPEAIEKDELPLIYTCNQSSEEWTKGMKGTIFSVGYFFFGSLVLIFFMNFTNQRMPRGLDPLPDVGHELIPKMRPEKLGDFTQIAIIATFVVCMIFFQKKETRWPIITKFFLTLGTLYLIRSISVYVTSVPATDNHCRHGYQNIPNIYWNTIKGFFTLGSANIHCGDLMFSGHTCMVTNVWLSLNRNYKKNYFLRIYLTILVLLTFIFIIGTRSHYTIDIWIALWLTVFVHAWTPAYFPFTRRNMRKVLDDWF